MDADEANNSWGKSSVVTFNSADVKPADLDKFLGEYSSTGVPVKITFTKEGNVLVADVTGQGKVNLTQTDVNRFEFAEAGAVFEFTPGKPEFVLEQGGGKYTFTKK
jgi:hypothetical protein